MSRMNDILRDSKGFLWFASSQGLTRFDGYEFRTFGLEDGLPTKVITVLMQDRDGTYWLGTNKGLCHFDGSKFTLYAGHYVTALMQDSRGRIWCGTLNGLYLPKKQAGETPVTGIAEDSAGAVWVSTEEALYKLEDGKPAVAFTAKDGIPGRMSSLLSDHRGRLWLATWSGLCLLNTANARGPIVQRKWTTADGLSSNIIHALFRSSGGVIWALTEHGLSSWQEAADEPVFRIHHDAQGWLKGNDEMAAEDRNGSLWIGTETHGVVRASLNGLTTLGTAEGLLSNMIRDLFADNKGSLLAVTRIDSPDASVMRRYRGQILYRLSDNGLQATNPAYPQSLKKPGWGEGQIVLQDHLGEWWITSEQGLFRFPAVPLEKLSVTSPLTRYTAADGLRRDDVYRLHEDARGDIWVGTMGGGAFRWQRGSQRFERIGSLEDSASAFADDNAGNVWLGWFSRNKLSRFRHGQLQTFDNANGLSRGWVTDIFKDRLGRIWVTTTGGLSRIDNPCDEVPRIQNYAAVSAFSGHRFYCITEDKNGVLYVGSDNGLEAFNATTGSVRHLGMKDGLPADEVMRAYCDRRGVLWFGTHGGLVRLEPAKRRATTDIPLRIVGLQIGGQPWPVAKLGETHVANLRVNPGENVLQIDYTDLGFGAAGELRFQYLLGSGNGWSAASKDRTLHFAGLAPGNYKLSIRAVDVLGQPVSEPVTATFRVMPQFWQTWWFQLLCLAFAASIGAVIHRYRVSRLLAVQKLRSRIALDLHDEVGSGLTQIAIWSELARRHRRDDQLEQIAASSRSLIDTIGDIVWTVNPRRDSVRELIQRVRYFATEICTSSDIDLKFEAAGSGLDRGANSEIRRDVFLIAKEALHNAVKHAACSRIEVNFLILSDALELQVADNGRGLTAGRAEGNGLASMRQRARALQGIIEFLPGEEGGTRVQLRMPLKRMRRKLPVSIAALLRWRYRLRAYRYGQPSNSRSVSGR
jgi:ligand-binding sensor domain-containing protein